MQRNRLTSTNGTPSYKPCREKSFHDGSYAVARKTSFPVEAYVREFFRPMCARILLLLVVLLQLRHFGAETRAILANTVTLLRV